MIDPPTSIGNIPHLRLDSRTVTLYARHEAVRKDAHQQEELEKQFRGMNIAHLRLRTGEPYMPELTKFFRLRLDRQRRP